LVVGARVGHRIIWIKGAGALFLKVAIDILAARCQTDAIELKLAVSLDTQAESPARADVICRAMPVELAGNATIYASPVFAVEPEHTIEARIAAGSGLDAALALPGYVDALAAGLAVRSAQARTAARKHALLDRSATDIVTARFDTNQARSAIAVGIAQTSVRT
jgi:hypothetical protein